MDEKNLLDGLPEPSPHDIGWDRKNARKLIWKTRLRLIYSVIASVLLLLTVYGVYNSIVTINYKSSHKDQQFNRFVATYVETHFIGVKVDNTMGQNGMIGPNLTQQSNLKLYKYIGDWQTVIGEVKATKPVNGRVQITLDRSQKYLHENTDFSFAAPPELINRPARQNTSGQTDPVWNQVHMIGDGYVAEMAFSTAKSLDPEELRQRLEKMNLRLLAMPVYAGELTTIHNLSYSSSGGDVFLPALSLRPYVHYDSDGNNNGGMSFSSCFEKPEQIKESINGLQSDLKWMIDYGDYSGKDTDAERLAYLQQHGVKVYGAVVTGPIRELEKLKQQPDFFNFQLGRIEVWNWNQYK